MRIEFAECMVSACCMTCRVLQHSHSCCRVMLCCRVRKLVTLRRTAVWLHGWLCLLALVGACHYITCSITVQYVGTHVFRFNSNSICFPVSCCSWVLLRLCVSLFYCMHIRIWILVQLMAVSRTSYEAYLSKRNCRIPSNAAPNLPGVWV